MNFEDKKKLRHRRRLSIRKKVLGTVSRPRLSLHFSNKHAYAQCIDDDSGQTLVYLSTYSKSLPQELKINVKEVASFGKTFGGAVLSAGVTSVVFDRGIKCFHGRVKAFADSVRDTGVKF